MAAALELPATVGEHALAAGVQGFQAMMTELNGNLAFTNNLARLQAQQRFGEIDILESRAASGVMATPIASPTTQAPAAP